MLVYVVYTLCDSLALFDHTVTGLVLSAYIQ